ncbi:hypothetical protein K1T71_004790 [Dendrolimus kikuchii]|uniref:Uncharacterized protein n=1 Tax=Dendrolimus kikuchii TaxID=765133 RepID=A0ACC1D568_9NEOP|nr:hypothetical protein K1T71_004790 [Dendrolimus kikuchii]
MLKNQFALYYSYTKLKFNHIYQNSVHVSQSAIMSFILSKRGSDASTAQNLRKIRYISKFYYKKGKNTTQAAKKNSYVYGPNAVSVRVAQIWFKRFQSGNFDIKDARRSGRPVTDKIDVIFEKVEQDRHISSYDVAGELGIDHKTVLAHLKKAGYTKKLDIWVPHELTERNLINYVLNCDSLLRRNETKPFLKKLITGDEKWIMYDKNPT